MISKGFDLTKYEIVLSGHALRRANQRNIDIDLVYYTVKTGRIAKFGKNNLRFIKMFKEFTLICIDEMKSDKIKIVTIVVKRK